MKFYSYFHVKWAKKKSVDMAASRLFRKQKSYVVKVIQDTSYYC